MCTMGGFWFAKSERKKKHSDMKVCKVDREGF